MPYSLASAIGHLLELLSALTFSSKDPPLTSSMVRMIGREFSTNAAAARHNLRYVERTSRAGRGLACTVHDEIREALAGRALFAGVRPTK